MGILSCPHLIHPLTVVGWALLSTDVVAFPESLDDLVDFSE